MGPKNYYIGFNVTLFYIKIPGVSGMKRSDETKDQVNHETPKPFSTEEDYAAESFKDVDVIMQVTLLPGPMRKICFLNAQHWFH